MEHYTVQCQFCKGSRGFSSALKPLKAGVLKAGRTSNNLVRSCPRAGRQVTLSHKL